MLGTELTVADPGSKISKTYPLINCERIGHHPFIVHLEN
jgi:hypothetical protein